MHLNAQQRRFSPYLQTTSLSFFFGMKLGGVTEHKIQTGWSCSGKYDIPVFFLSNLIEIIFLVFGQHCIMLRDVICVCLINTIRKHHVPEWTSSYQCVDQRTLLEG